MTVNYRGKTFSKPHLTSRRHRQESNIRIDPFRARLSAIPKQLLICLRVGRKELEHALHVFHHSTSPRRRRPRLQHCQHIRRCLSGRPRHVQKPHARKLILQLSDLQFLLHHIIGLPTLSPGWRPMGPSNDAPRSAPSHLQTLQSVPRSLLVQTSRSHTCFGHLDPHVSWKSFIAQEPPCQRMRRRLSSIGT